MTRMKTKRAALVVAHAQHLGAASNGAINVYGCSLSGDADAIVNQRIDGVPFVKALVNQPMGSRRKHAGLTNHVSWQIGPYGISGVAGVHLFKRRPRRAPTKQGPCLPRSSTTTTLRRCGARRSIQHPQQLWLRVSRP